MDEQECCRACGNGLVSRHDARRCSRCGAPSCWQCIIPTPQGELCSGCMNDDLAESDFDDSWGV